MLSDFAKVFERKVWRVQVAHLHNAARALSSPSRCFQLFKKTFRIEEYLAKEKKKLNVHLMKWEKLLQSLSRNNFTLGSLVLIFLFILLSMLSSNFFFFLSLKSVKVKNTIKYIKKSIWCLDDIKLVLEPACSYIKVYGLRCLLLLFVTF